MSISTSSFDRCRIEDDQDSLVVPEMDQDEVFGLIDDFYDDPPPRPVVASLGVDDDEFYGLMHDLEELEKSTRELDGDGDVLMHGVSSPLHPPDAIDQEPQATPHTRVDTPVASPDVPEDQQLEASHDVLPSPSLQAAHVFDDKTSSAAPESTKEEHPNTKPPPDATMQEESSSPHSPEPFNENVTATPPQLNIEPKVPQNQRLQTPSLPSIERLTDSARVSSVAPSTGGHRSSMQGEMRQEEQELDNGDLGDLPPFPGFRAGGDVASEDAVGPSLPEGDREEVRDLSSSRDVGEQQAPEAAKPSPNQQVLPPTPSLEPAVESTATEAPLGLTAPTKTLKRGRPTSSPSFTTAKKPRLLSPELASESPQISTNQDAEVTRTPNDEEADSSLSEISLSAVLEMTPEQTNAQTAPATDLPPASIGHERKDSATTSLQEFKAEAPPSPKQKEDTVKQKPATKPKATPRRTRSSKPAPSPAPTAKTTTKITKTATGKAKKPPAAKSGIKNMISSGILADVLKPKGTRQTRAEKKAIADSRPDPAQAAKRRHTDVINYKE